MWIMTASRPSPGHFRGSIGSKLTHGFTFLTALHSGSEHLPWECMAKNPVVYTQDTQYPRPQLLWKYHSQLFHVSVYPTVSGEPEDIPKAAATALAGERQLDVFWPAAGFQMHVHSKCSSVSSSVSSSSIRTPETGTKKAPRVSTCTCTCTCSQHLVRIRGPAPSAAST